MAMNKQRKTGNILNIVSYDASGNVSLPAGLDQNNVVGRPYAVWGATSATGPVVIKFPGTSANYGMVHAVIDIYEYNSNNVSTIIVGGHNWNGQWYSYGANVIGFTDKQVRVGFKDGQYCIVIGDSGSTWTYGQVVLRKIHNGPYYVGVMNVGSGYTLAVEADTYTWVSGDLRGLRVPNSISVSGNTVLHAGNYNSYSPTLTGGNASGSWNINAATATALQTARTINGVSFNGSANIAVGSLYDTNYRRFTNPAGGEYVTQTGSVTGAIAVTLPVNMSLGNMMRVTIKVYEYTTNQSFEIHAGGYLYNSPPSAPNTWANNPFAYIVGNPGIDRRFTVRFGFNTAADKAVIYIGELGTVWSYPQVFVTEMQVGFAGMISSLTDAFSIGFESSAFQNVTATISNAQVGYAVSTNTVNAAVLRDGSGNFSAGTITATLNGTASNATTLGGLSLQAGSTAAGVNQVLRSDASGYVFFNYINSNTGNSENPAISQVIVTNGSDNYYRKASIAHLTSAVQSNASGSWGISITGNAATVTNGVYLTGDQTISGTKVFNTPSNTFIGTVAQANQGLTVFQPNTSGDAYMTFHITGDYAAFFGLGGAENDLVYGGWSAGATRRRILHSGNYTAWAPSLTGTGATGTWGISITGDAASVGSIAASRIVYGDNSTKTTLTSNVNTLGYSGFFDAENATGAPTSGASVWYNYINVRHRDTGSNYSMQIAGEFFNADNLFYRNINNGTASSWYKIWHANTMDAPNRKTNGSSYYDVNTWFSMNGNFGIYWPNHYGAHFTVNDTSSYGQYKILGNKAGYDGFYSVYSGVNGFMYDASGNGGVYRESSGKWYWFYSLGNDCMGIGGSTTSGSYRLYVNGPAYASGSMTATAFFESSDIRLKTILGVNPDISVDVDVIKFERKDASGVRYGYSAQQVQEIMPELVAGDDFLSVNYLDLHTLKIAALEKEIRELKAKLGN